MMKFCDIKISLISLGIRAELFCGWNFWEKVRLYNFIDNEVVIFISNFINLYSK